MRYMLPVLMVAACVAAADDELPVVFLDDGANTGTLGVYASGELEGYFGRMFTNPVTTDADASHDLRIVLGTPDSHGAVAEAAESGRLPLPEGPLADQGYTLKRDNDVLYVAGLTDQGVLYGVYTLLENYGAYFQFSGERLPAPVAFALREMDVTAVPAFKYRGLLPWDNFLCGMSGYNLEDYQELIDRASRMKLNMLQFHFYPGMAFFTETVDGVRVPPNVIGMPVDVFPTSGAVGEAVFGDEAVFGPRPYVENMGNPEAQANAVQAMMRSVLDHAQARGMRTVVGFELMEPPVDSVLRTDKPDGGLNFLDPLRPENVELSLQRYRSLVETYPQSDYYWMWQSEARGYLSRQAGQEPGAAEMRAAHAQWTALDTHGGDIDYAYHFRDVANRLSPEERARLATGGWSIQHLFPGIHPDFPPEIRFASLNPYPPDQTLEDHMDYYRVAGDGRPAWMIDWWEFDGEQWFPQWRVTWQEQMYRKCLEYGVEAVTLLGWKLSGLEHNVRYLADFSWNPDLTAEQFYAEYVRRLYGQDAEAMTAIFLAYDAMAPNTPPANPFDDRPMLLGAGWMALGIPAFPGTEAGLESDDWLNTVKRAGEIADEQRALLEKDREAIAAIGLATPGLDAQGQSWASLMLNRLRVRVHYLESMIALNEAYGAFHAHAVHHGLEAANKAVSEPLGKAVDFAREAIAYYARDIRNRSDLGVVAQMNAQYYQPLKRFHLSVAGYESPYVQVDPDGFRTLPHVVLDLADETAVPPRDGKITVEKDEYEGRPTLRLTIGGEKTPFNSVFLHQEPLALDEAPFLDLTLRTDSDQPLAIMFLVDDDPAWQALNLIGRQQLYAQLDGLPGDVFAEAAWRRVTWDLRRLVREQVRGEAQTVHSVILGSWETPDPPITVEIRECLFGDHRTLD